jgi:hypothetical protein
LKLLGRQPLCDGAAAQRLNKHSVPFWKQQIKPSQLDSGKSASPSDIGKLI